MCGILAIIWNIYKQKKENTNSIQLGFESLSKRGPESGNIHEDMHGIFCFKRLAINDLSSSGMQPFVKGRVSVVCNGEIYNHLKLKQKYNISTVSSSDCECILELYLLLGFEKMIKELNGIFAIVISDDNFVYFATDRIGVRPLHYGFSINENLIIGSTAESLSFFRFNGEIKNLKPSIASYNKTTNEISFVEYGCSVDEINYPLYPRINKLLEKAVRNQLISDRPIGCMLSGGLDSSLICSILCKSLGAKNVRTYSIGMKGSTDLKYARFLSTELGTNHTEVLFTPDEGIAAIPFVIKDLESYDITTVRASVGMWLLSKYISKNTQDKVIFSGEGADELFCGYLYFHYAPSFDELNKESKRLVDNLYKYDVLRADRCVSSHGLELRVPFLDNKLVSFCMSMTGKSKSPINGIEKDVLRQSFSNGYLPADILWRRKEGYSDGVSSIEKSWCEYIKDHVEMQISNEEFEPVRSEYPSKEAYYYKKIFDDMFPRYRPVIEYWMPKWIDCNGDPSGRKLPIFNKSR